MIKGINKNMVVIKNVGSPIFEEAYFILRDGASDGNAQTDLIAEANRIVGQGISQSSRCRVKKGWVKPLLFGACMLLIGVGLGILLGFFAF